MRLVFPFIIASLGLAPGFFSGVAAAAQTSCVVPGQYYLPAQQTFVSVDTVLPRLAKRRVILLGEHHDNAEHHRWQLHTLAALRALRPKVALGIEMLPRRVQPLLDRWTRGELSEEEFIKQLDWDQYWSFDLGYYLPLFQLARMQRMPIYALNVERELFNRVSREGWEAIPETQREGVGNPAPATKEYLRFLAGSFLRHNPSLAPGDAPLKADEGQKFLRFVQGQQLWDRAMAEGLANIARGDDAPLVVGVMGSWHMANRRGVPQQLADLGIGDAALLVPWDAHFDCAELNKDFADAVFGIDTPIPAAEK